MPFSRRRRRGYANQRLVIPLAQKMPVPDDILNLAYSTSSGINAGIVGNIPAEPNANLEVGDAAGGPVVAERPNSSQIGTYCFNFSRLAFHSLVNALGPNPATLFKRARFGKGYHTIERIDLGASSFVGTQPPVEASNNPNLTSFAYANSLPLHIWYRRLSPHESTFDQSLQSSAYFRMHPKTRMVRLWPGKSVTFTFSPRVFTAPRYMAQYYRDWSNVALRESDQTRRVELPSRSRRLGWFPAGCIALQNRLNPNPDGRAESLGGLDAGVFSIVSPTIAFCFGLDAVAGYQLQFTGSAADGLRVVGPQNILNGVLLRRREFTTVALSGFAYAGAYSPENQTLRGGNAVGQIIQVSPWNGAGASHNTIECFDPPRINSIVNGTGCDYALWRAGDTFNVPVLTGTFSSHSIPYDLQQAALPDTEPGPDVPVAGEVP